jgi:hypothetical protein
MNRFFFPDYVAQQNPLDFLDEIKRKPRSSMESNERTTEIPICDPAFILRRDSNRSRRQFDSYSPQHSPCRLPSLKFASFMDHDNFEEDVDFLWPARRRLPSETNMSSHLQTLSSGGLTSNEFQHCCPDSSFPLFENEMADEMAHGNMEEITLDAPCLKDTTDLFVATPQQFEESILQ